MHWVSGGPIRPRGPGKRKVRMAPLGGDGTHLLRARRATSEQHAPIGNPCCGRVWPILPTDDFWRNSARTLRCGARVCETLRDADYDAVAVIQGWLAIAGISGK